MTHHRDDSRCLCEYAVSSTHTPYTRRTHTHVCVYPRHESRLETRGLGRRDARGRPRAVRLSTARETNGACDASDDARARAEGWMIGEMKDARVRSFARARRSFARA